MTAILVQSFAGEDGAGGYPDLERHPYETPRWGPVSGPDGPGLSGPRLTWESPVPPVARAEPLWALPDRLISVQFVPRRDPRATRRSQVGGSSARQPEAPRPINPRPASPG